MPQGVKKQFTENSESPQVMSLVSTGMRTQKYNVTKKKKETEFNDTTDLFQRYTYK